MQKLVLIFIILIAMVGNYCGQDLVDNREVYEVFLIDAYVTPEQPYTFVLTFFTGDSVKSKVILNKKYEFIVSDTFQEDHKIKIDLTKYNFDTSSVPFIINIETLDGERLNSEKYDLALPNSYNIKMKDTPGLFTTCCLGGVVFGIPSPNYIITSDNKYFSLTKEIPVLTYYSHGYNYPSYYFSIEYTYIFKSEVKHIARAGLKKIFLLDFIEYISPGITYFNDLKGGDGLGPELSIGWFKLSTVFTLYTKYRFNYNFGEGNKFHEFSLGLYSSFFSINL